ncbi:hypothetical protein E2C01_012738 [Portunus trituberculatus]|uniref:Uncharacterized protein n=1 Tax=Portunus trituberculatus TaxID=210409 RepID=A0A5B7DEP0_PORTR|nr:hypothetical protein [Portunus trituberculatus]
MGDSSRAHQREARERAAQWCCDGARGKTCARDSRDFVVTLGIFVTQAAKLKIVARRDGLCSTVVRGDAGGLWVNTGYLAAFCLIYFTICFTAVLVTPACCPCRAGAGTRYLPLGPEAGGRLGEESGLSHLLSLGLSVLHAQDTSRSNTQVVVVPVVWVHLHSTPSMKDDHLLTELRSSNVYKFICPSCQAGYIGSTIRAFKAHVDEHKGQLSRMDHRSHNPPYSAVRDHSEVLLVSPWFPLLRGLNYLTGYVVTREVGAKMADILVSSLLLK